MLFFKLALVFFSIFCYFLVSNGFQTRFFEGFFVPQQLKALGS